jgi:glyoxylase-like metal-dependent hydrolase (beta-lactamase superfamily II)
VIDPGPADERHVAVVREAAERRGGIAGALLTHSHADHTAAVPLLGAPVLFGEVGTGDELSIHSAGGAAGVRSPEAERQAEVRGPDPAATGPAAANVGPFTVVPTPGHAVDHVCFVLGDVCFCGDLILGEGSTIVPPASLGGSLAEYMSSLERVRALDAALLCPGHGPWINDPAAKIAEYVEHRLMRERRLVAALERGERSRERLLDEVWDDVPAVLRPAAAFAMQAHLEKLEAEGRLPNDLHA